MGKLLQQISEDALKEMGHEIEFVHSMGHYVSVKEDPTFCWMKCTKCGRTFEGSLDGIWLIKQMLNGYAYESVYDKNSLNCSEMIIKDVIK